MSENIWQEALRRTRRGPLGQLAGIFGATELDEDFWERLEAGLIQADVGVQTSLDIVQELQQAAREHGWFEATEAREGLRRAILSRLRTSSEVEPHGRPHVILMVGVNGSGKTTSAARLAYRLKERGHSVMLAAADTYRAAAVEQLTRWAERLDAPIVRGIERADPGSVVFQACQQAANQSIEVVIADTSGRMHTHHNLMEELKKIHRVAGKAAAGGPHETLLVLDATTGQNALMQAESFLEAIPVTGAVLAKLDHSARGGVAIAINSELDLPLQYVGLGEAIEDLHLFDPEKYIEGLLTEV